MASGRVEAFLGAEQSLFIGDTEDDEFDGATRTHADAHGSGVAV